MEFARTACWVVKRCKESRAIAAKVVGRCPGHKGPSEEHQSRAADQRQAAQEPRFPRSSGGSGGMHPPLTEQVGVDSLSFGRFSMPGAGLREPFLTESSCRSLRAPGLLNPPWHDVNRNLLVLRIRGTPHFLKLGRFLGPY